MAHRSRWQFRVDVHPRKLGAFQAKVAALMGRPLEFEVSTEDGLLVATVEHEGGEAAAFHEAQALCLTLSPRWTIELGGDATRAEARRPDVSLPGLVEVRVDYVPLPQVPFI